MRLLLVVCPEALEDEMRALLDQAHTPGWTEVRHLVGRGHTGPRLGSTIWPGNNSMFMSAVEDADAARMAGILTSYAAQFRERPGGMSVRAFSLPCEQIV